MSSTNQPNVTVKRNAGDFTFYEKRGQRWACKTCGGEVKASIKFVSVWDGPFPCSGSGEVEEVQLPYCPNCEIKP